MVNGVDRRYHTVSYMFHALLMMFCFFFKCTLRLVDNLPVATRVYNPETKEVQFEHGYRLGQVIKGNTYINNHLKFILSYHMHTKWVHLICIQISLKIFKFSCSSKKKKWHIKFIVYCRDKYRVVGFQVEPISVSLSDIKFEGDSCNFPDTPKLQVVSARGLDLEHCFFYWLWKWDVFLFSVLVAL